MALLKIRDTKFFTIPKEDVNSVSIYNKKQAQIVK